MHLLSDFCSVAIAAFVLIYYGLKNTYRETTETTTGKQGNGFFGNEANNEKKHPYDRLTQEVLQRHWSGWIYAQ